MISNEPVQQILNLQEYPMINKAGKLTIDKLKWMRIVLQLRNKHHPRWNHRLKVSIHPNLIRMSKDDTVFDRPTLFQNSPMNQNIFHMKDMPQQCDLLLSYQASLHSSQSSFYILKSLFQFRSRSTFTDLHIVAAIIAL
jgi:hypothetical protein